MVSYVCLIYCAIFFYFTIVLYLLLFCGSAAVIIFVATDVCSSQVSADVCIRVVYSTAVLFKYQQTDTGVIYSTWYFMLLIYSVYIFSTAGERRVSPCLTLSHLVTRGA